ncbi:MAG: hypothetical protein H6585_06760 [Flavobacteriales bacterium]|nr:hypothetical protein [Flavobacteriales bacterium]
MKKVLAGLLLVIASPFVKAQGTWECGYVDLGKGILEQTVLLTQTENDFKFAFKDSVNTSVVEQLQKAIPPYDEILEVDFGPTTFLYNIDGSTVVFRKCKSAVSTSSSSADLLPSKQP